MDYFSEFPRRPRKRPRLAWDSFPKSQSGAYYEQDLGNVASYGHPRLLPEHGNPFLKGLDQRGSPPWRDDDKDGHYMFAIGDNFTPRYKIGRKIGEGTFGQVLECWDRYAKEMVAIKVVRSIKKYREAAMTEIDVLQLLGKYDRTGGRCVQIRHWFDYRNHICIVFEMLGPSLFDFLRKNNYRPFPADLVRSWEDSFWNA